MIPREEFGVLLRGRVERGEVEIERAEEGRAERGRRGEGSDRSGRRGKGVERRGEFRGFGAQRGRQLRRRVSYAAYCAAQHFRTIRCGVREEEKSGK